MTFTHLFIMVIRRPRSPLTAQRRFDLVAMSPTIDNGVDLPFIGGSRTSQRRQEMLPPVLPSVRSRKGKGGVRPTHDWSAGDQEAARFSLAYQGTHGQLPDKGTLVDHMETWWGQQKTTPHRKVIARKLPRHLYRDE